MASLPEPLRDAVDAEGQFRKPDGSPLEAEEIREQVEAAQSPTDARAKSPAERIGCRARPAATANLRRLAEMLKQAAQKSAASPLALAKESKLLDEFAGRHNRWPPS